MNKIFVVTLAFLVNVSFVVFNDKEVHAAFDNDYPLVLVHGFMGFGRDEMLGYKYWGGFGDLQEDLNDKGYETYTGVVSPVGSNWDRACELYAYIKGGTVDYGKGHSDHFGHYRFGRTFPGIYPQWGQINPSTGKLNKIHLIGHSQGGQTIRVLAQLLEQGHPSASEAGFGPDCETSNLFAGENPWIHSITTISTPHDGTSLANGINLLIPFAQQFIASIAAVTDGLEDSLYDFKIDQWGLNKEPDESYSEYADRVWESNIWHDTKDISAWDLSPDGANELNAWVEAQSNIYYFSWATEQTYRSWFTGHELNEASMNAALIGPALFMGSYTRNEPGFITIDSSWFKNDGVVNTNSMDGPDNGSSDTIVSYNATSSKGVWNYMGLLESMDHGDVVGILPYPWDLPLGYDDLQSWYYDIAHQLRSLPE